MDHHTQPYGKPPGSGWVSSGQQTRRCDSGTPDHHHFAGHSTNTPSERPCATTAVTTPCGVTISSGDAGSLMLALSNTASSCCDT